jgi:xanthine/uracil permease
MTSMNSNGTSGQGASATALIGRLFDDATALLRNEVQLAKAEFVNTTNELKARALAFAAGGILLVVGALVLVAAAVLGLATVVEPWLAAVIVGVVLAVIGAILVSAARKKLESGKLDRTKASLERDANVVARRT